MHGDRVPHIFPHLVVFLGDVIQQFLGVRVVSRLLGRAHQVNHRLPAGEKTALTIQDTQLLVARGAPPRIKNPRKTVGGRGLKTATRRRAYFPLRGLVLASHPALDSHPSGDLDGLRAHEALKKAQKYRELSGAETAC